MVALHPTQIITVATFMLFLSVLCLSVMTATELDHSSKHLNIFGTGLFCKYYISNGYEEWAGRGMDLLGKTYKQKVSK